MVATTYTCISKQEVHQNVHSVEMHIHADSKGKVALHSCLERTNIKNKMAHKQKADTVRGD